MSDLSHPPLALVSDEVMARTRPAPAVESVTERFLWPTPPYAAYPGPSLQTQPEPCEIEGPNGKVTGGRMIFINPVMGIVHVQVPPARGTLVLRFAQFRRITLTRPVSPEARVLNSPPARSGQQDATETVLSHAPTQPALLDGLSPDLLSQAPTLRFAALWSEGGCTEGQSVGHLETPFGHFLFPPCGSQGDVLRTFIPRSAVTSLDWGSRIGEVLVEQRATTSQQVDDALAEQELLRTRKLGDILVDQQIVSPQQLLAAIDQQARMPMVRIGEALMALQFIDASQLAAALEQQTHDRSVPLGELLVRRGDVTRADLQTALARKMGYPIVDVSAFPVEADALAKVPFAVARRLPALPLLMRSGRVVVALEDPAARSMIDELEFTAQCKMVPVLARSGTLPVAIERAYQQHGHETWRAGAEGGNTAAKDLDGDTAGKLVASLEQQHTAGSEGDDDVLIEQSDNQLVRLINSMILEANAQGVSDIHIETHPGREKIRIRFRKDGVIRPYLELPHNYRAALVARIKIMCDLDISERRKPQDGKINFSRFVSGHRLELRVATIPTTGGAEDVVMRLLASAKPIPLDNMGLSPTVLKGLKTVIGRPYGMVLCVGPTGSGKTTTLHAALGYINTPDRKIWTAEDPVEITQSGLRQVQVNPKIDFTFAKALRAFLRADPDVVMVGEIRDKETAQMAIEASLTGHLVMSTLHTNSAPETVTRLLDMGMDPFNFADSLLAVLAQRLARRLCKHCVTATPASAEKVDELLHDWLNAFPDKVQAPKVDDLHTEWLGRFARDGRLMNFQAPGCGHCGDSGFAGRVGLHELMTVNRDLRHLIQTGARADEVQRVAMADSMRTLRQDGIEKVMSGLTSIEEVRATSNT